MDLVVVEVSCQVGHHVVVVQVTVLRLVDEMDLVHAAVGHALVEWLTPRFL